MSGIYQICLVGAALRSVKCSGNLAFCPDVVPLSLSVKVRRNSRFSELIQSRAAF
jgi:hypothetical protein